MPEGLTPSEDERSVELQEAGDSGWSWEQLRGKRVLDIGAGSGGFALEAKKHGVDVISLEPAEERVSPDTKKEVPFVSGLAQHLPFADESFDYAHSRAFPWVRLTPEKAKNILNEALRVLKPNGQFVFIAPVSLRLSPESVSAPYNTLENVKQRYANQIRSAEFLRENFPHLGVKRLPSTGDLPRTRFTLNKNGSPEEWDDSIYDVAFDNWRPEDGED